MSRTLLGVRAHGGPLLTLASMAAVVTGGTVTVLGFAAEADTSPWLALPLLVIGALAVPAAGHELAVARREEIGLARLRGVHGRRLTALMLAEPMLAIAVGTLAGVALGLTGTWLSSWLWLAEPTVTVTTSALVAAGGVVLAGTLAVGAGMAAAGREPLADQVRPSARTRPASTAALFGSVLLLVAAVLAVYRSGRGTDPDWVVLAGPALVGLAAGQLTVWLLRAVARIATARTSRGPLPAFLATRRVGRAPDRGTALRLLVAAGAVATLAATAAAGVEGWSADSARLSAGAPLRVTFDADAQAALATSEQHDPEGRWLMAAVVVPESAALERRALVDTARFDSVVGDFLDGTAAAGVRDELGALAADVPPAVVGDRLTVAVREVPVTDADIPGDLAHALRLTIHYVGLDGAPGRVSVVLREDDRGPVTATAPVECDGGCTVTRLEIDSGVLFEGDFFVVDEGLRPPVELTRLSFGAADLDREAWTISSPGGPSAPDLDDESEVGTVETTAEGLVLEFPDSRRLGARSGSVAAEPTALRSPLPVLAAGGLTWERDPEIKGPSGAVRPAELVGRLPALPLVGGAGLLADLRAGMYGAGPTIPAAEVMVLAAEDTPSDVLDALVDDGGTLVRVDDIAVAEARATGAVQAWVYAVMAGCCLVVALLALLAAGARQRAAYRRDVAALRVVGVPTAQIRSAGRGELVLLAAIAVVAGVGAGLLAARLLLSDLPLVDVPEFAIPLDPVSSVLPALGSGLVLAVIVVAVAGRGRRLDPELTRPAILREEQWREVPR